METDKLKKIFKHGDVIKAIQTYHREEMIKFADWLTDKTYMYKPRPDIELENYEDYLAELKHLEDEGI